MNSLRFSLLTIKRSSWIRQICEYSRKIELIDLSETEVFLTFPNENEKNQLEPFHIVLLACFIEQLKTQGCSKCTLNAENPEIYDIIANKLHINKYFDGIAPSCHEESEDDRILNLWKVIDAETYSYGLSVTSFFSRKYFNDYQSIISTN